MRKWFKFKSLLSAVQCQMIEESSKDTQSSSYTYWQLLAKAIYNSNEILHLLRNFNIE